MPRDVLDIFPTGGALSEIHRTGRALEQLDRAWIEVGRAGIATPAGQVLA
jgi:hypothetical protein